MPTIPSHPLGRSGLRVAPICLGSNVFGWTVDKAMSHRPLDAWIATIDRLSAPLPA